MTSITTVALLAFLAIHEVSSSLDQGMNLRCRCITKEKTPIGRLIRLNKLEINPANSHCKDLEIIAIYKKNGQKICLDPDAQWVKKMLKRKLRTRKLGHRVA